jgi:hypothetical protein
MTPSEATQISSAFDLGGGRVRANPGALSQRQPGLIRDGERQWLFWKREEILRPFALWIMLDAEGSPRRDEASLAAGSEMKDNIENRFEPFTLQECGTLLEGLKAYQSNIRDDYCSTPHRDVREFLEIRIRLIAKLLKELKRVC